MRLFVYDGRRSRDPFLNLAVEAHLMERVPDDAAVLYLWQNDKTVVIGRNQNAWRECRAEELEAAGGHLARRLTGGGAVYHDEGNLNFTFCAPEALYDVEKQTAVIAAAARAFGIAAERTGRNDLTAEGRKFSGNAFRRSGGKRLHHGTVLIDGDMTAMTRWLDAEGSKLRAKGVRSVPSRVINLRELAPELTVDAFAEAMKRSFSAVYGAPSSAIKEAALDREDIERKRRFFASWEWRFGQRLPFADEWRGVFPWGTLRLSVRAEGGVIQEAAAESDGMASEIIAAIPGALRGVRYGRDAMAAAILALPAAGTEERAILADAADMIRKDRYGAETRGGQNEI